MVIRTYQALSGYVSSSPSMKPTQDGTPRFYALAGQKRAHREQDGTYTPEPTEYIPIVAYGDAAVEAAARLRKGHDFIAAGRMRPVKYEKDGKTVDSEEFEFWTIERRHTAAGRTARAGRELGGETPAREASSREVPTEFTASRQAAPASRAIAL